MSHGELETLYVDQQQLLDSLCSRWLSLPMVALDTEFMRTNTYYPKPALIQVNDGSANYLIDPLRLSNLDSFARVLQCPQVVKILHACSEDLEVFHRMFAALPEPLFDTQIAAAFVGLGFSMGYSRLVETMLNIQLPKGETRSDWLQRPLTEAQQHYAALDVEYLFVIARQLRSQLQHLQREQWVTDECQDLLSSFNESQNIDNAIHRFRSAWRLDARQLELLKRLAVWRDQTAQSRDVPRSYVVKDKSLYQIAEMIPSHVGLLRKVEELPDKAIRRYGDALIEMAQGVAELAVSELPERMPKSPSSKQQSMIKLLREKLSEVAQSLNLAPEYLARKKDYEYIVRAAELGATGTDLLPPNLSGWRAEYVKPVVAECL